MAEIPKWTDTPDADFSAAQPLDKSRALATKERPPNPSRFKFERINEVTWKLTNGELITVPASHGQWGSYRATKALAWVICLVPGNWLARCGDQACGPASLSEAKAAAMRMAKGAVGCFVVIDPVTHLNGLAALLADREGAT